MRWLDRAIDALPPPLARRVLLADALARLGPAWVAFRVRYALELRLGIVERRCPVEPWPPLGDGARVPEIVAADVLGAWLREHAGPERVEGLRAHAEALRRREFDVFGRRVVLDSWHHDPVHDVRYDPAPHWTRVEVAAGADVKYVWEPSRFGWAFDLARLHLVDPASGAADLFWELLDEWCEQNPPNAGINWACGQEASIRLIAATCAASAMRDVATPERAATLRRLAWVTADRVAANIAYARSQRNNHHASEAVGLLTAALLYPGSQRGDTWRRLGERHLHEVCETLVFPDGGTSQYSTNYHRVFVHDLVWAVECHRAAGVPVANRSTEALAIAAELLHALTEPISGSGPFFGADDGARVLPLHGGPHRRLADDVELARSSLVGGRCDEGPPRVEPPAWFGHSDAPPAQPSVSRSFERAGVHLLVDGATRAFVRAGQHRFRPSHDDALHVELWSRGRCLTPDAGTGSYAPGAGEAETERALDGASSHNGPRHPHRPAMRKATRFLWATWSRSGPVGERILGASTSASFELEGPAGPITRTVELRDGIDATVTDRGPLGLPLSAVWRLDHDDPAALAAMHDAGLSVRPLALGYGDVTEVPAVEIETDDGDRRPLVFSIDLRTSVGRAP